MRVTIGFSTDDGMRDTLQAQADRDNRTLSNLVDTLCREALQTRGVAVQPGTPTTAEYEKEPS